MIVRKIGNPVSKESKTQPANEESRKTIVPEQGSSGKSLEQGPGPQVRDPLESLMQDYLDSSHWPQPRVKSPPRKSASRPPLIPVETDTVREYKKYMQTPVALRDTLVKWRRRCIQEDFKLSSDCSGPVWQRRQLEHDFLSTLGFYGTVKEKVLSPLLNMQVH